MKLFTKFIAGTCVLAAIITVTYISSCKKQGTGQEEVKNEDQVEKKISSLIDKMYAVSDGTQDDAITSEYESLTADEFKIFQVRKLQRDSIEGIRDALADNRQLTPAKMAEFSAGVKETRIYRESFDDLAVKKFGRHSNRLTQDELREMAEAALKEINGGNSQTGGDNGKVDQVTGCAGFSGNGTATETNSADAGYFYRGRADNDPNWWEPCDFVFHWSGYYNRVRGERWEDRQLIRWYTNISKNTFWTGSNWETRLLFGAGGYGFYFGLAEINNAHLRMAYQ